MGGRLPPLRIPSAVGFCCLPLPCSPSWLPASPPAADLNAAPCYFLSWAPHSVTLSYTVPPISLAHTGTPVLPWGCRGTCVCWWTHLDTPNPGLGVQRRGHALARPVSGGWMRRSPGMAGTPAVAAPLLELRLRHRRHSSAELGRNITHKCPPGGTRQPAQTPAGRIQTDGGRESSARPRPDALRAILSASSGHSAYGAAFGHPAPREPHSRKGT